MPLSSLSSLLPSWELNTYLYVTSNTLYKDQGVFLFFLFFFVSYLVSSQPATRVRATDALRTVLVITTTLTLPAYHMHKRTATERMVRFSPVRWFFNFPGVDQPLYMLWYGYCLLSLNPLYCDIYWRLTSRRWTKLSKTPKVFHICPASLSLVRPLDPPLKCTMENNEALIIIPSKNTANV